MAVSSIDSWTIGVLSEHLPFEFHPAGLPDVLLAFAAIYLVILSLVTPPTPTWRLVRAGIVTPIASFAFFYFGFYPSFQNYTDQWGTPVLTFYAIIHTFELLVFFPAEEYSYRVLPRSPTAVKLSPKADATPNGSASTSKGLGTEWYIEAVPAPWTWKKFWWASSLFWGMRGIGWNFAPPLPSSSLRPPFTPGSSRKRYVWVRLGEYIIGWILLDLVRSYMNLSSGAAFFSGRPGSPDYTDLTRLQRAIYSICVVTRIVLGMERSHVACGIIFVTIGGIMGWETETCSPWGWPPLFGGFQELWRHPGLSQMWSRVSLLKDLIADIRHGIITFELGSGNSAGSDWARRSSDFPVLDLYSKLPRHSSRKQVLTLLPVQVPPHLVEYRLLIPYPLCRTIDLLRSRSPTSSRVSASLP